MTCIFMATNEESATHILIHSIGNLYVDFFTQGKVYQIYYDDSYSGSEPFLIADSGARFYCVELIADVRYLQKIDYATEQFTPNVRTEVFHSCVDDDDVEIIDWIHSHYKEGNWHKNFEVTVSMREFEYIEEDNDLKKVYVDEMKKDS